MFLPAATKLGQGNVFTGVCDCVHRGVGCLPQCMLGCQNPPREQTPHPPWEQTPPGADTPPDQAPQTRHPPRPGIPPTRHTIFWTRCPPDQAHHPPPPQTSAQPPASEADYQHMVNEWPVRILLECILVTPVCHSVQGGLLGFPACITGHMTGGSASGEICLSGGGGWGVSILRVRVCISVDVGQYLLWKCSYC